MVGDLSEKPRLEKALVVYRHDPSEVEKILAAEGFDVVKENPDFIVCFGGDGTVLFGERKFPGVPKLIVKTSPVCRKCDYTVDELRNVLRSIREGDYQIVEKMKLEAHAKGKTLVGLNEIQIHPKLPIYAVRFSLSVCGKTFNELIGDGVIVATPFGSTAYYEATGGKRFANGIGVSFNNLHRRKVDSFVVADDSVVKLAITRGPAWLLADNDENMVELNAGDTVEIKKSESVANFIYVSRP